MGIIKRIVDAIADPGSLADHPAREVEPDEPREAPETEQERRRRVQDALFGSDPRDGLVFRWPGR